MNKSAPVLGGINKQNKTTPNIALSGQRAHGVWGYLKGPFEFATTERQSPAALKTLGVI